jgi:transcriptional regulator with XRE-family HTH domain
MLTVMQSKMARAALGWSMKDLAERSGVSANTIDRFENGRAAPIPANLKALRRAFEAAGVKFNDQGGVDPPEAANDR